MIVKVEDLDRVAVANLCLSELRNTPPALLNETVLKITVPFGTELPDWVPPPTTPSVPTFLPDMTPVGNTFYWPAITMFWYCVLNEERAEISLAS